MLQRFKGSVAIAVLALACAGCRSFTQPQDTDEGPNKSPKVKYDAQWWSDNGNEKSVQSVLDRRKSAMEKHSEQAATILTQPQPAAHMRPSTSTGNDGNATWPPSEAPANDAGGLQSFDSLVTNDPPPGIDYSIRADEAGGAELWASQASWNEPPSLRDNSPGPVDRKRTTPTKLTERLDSAPGASRGDGIRLRAIAEDARGESIAMLAFSDGESLRVRENDRIAVVINGEVVNIRIVRIGAGVVKLEREDNKEVRLVR